MGVDNHRNESAHKAEIFVRVDALSRRPNKFSNVRMFSSVLVSTEQLG